METPEPYVEDAPPRAPAAPAGPQAGPLDGAIQETAQALRQMELEEAHLKQQLEQVRSNRDRLRGRLDALVEVNQAMMAQPNGTPPPANGAPRPERGRPRRK